MKTLITALAAVLGLLCLSQPATAGSNMQGWFCEACTNLESARQQAVLYAPSLQCSGTEGNILNPDSGLECQAPPAKTVVLGNREYNQVYVFEVTWQNTGDFWQVVATESSISPAYIDLAYTALDVTEAWSQAIIDINNDLAAAAGTSSASPASKGRSGTMSDPEPLDCPSDTLLRTLMDQAKMDSLRDRVATQLEVEVSRAISDGGAEMESTSVTVSRGLLSFGFNITGGGRPIPTGVEQIFTQREVNLNEDPPTGPGMPVLDRDRLVFSARGVNLGNGGRVTLTLEPGASRILGIRGDDFFDGRPITDPCALEAMALGDEGHGQEFRFREGGAVADPDETFAAGGGTSTPGGTSTRMCLYDFYSNNVYQFSAWMPCGDGDKEEIQD